jgi:hypothetical protein
VLDLLQERQRQRGEFLSRACEVAEEVGTTTSATILPAITRAKLGATTKGAIKPILVRKEL